MHFPYNEKNCVAARKEIPMEHTPDILRFERIEATLETLAKAVTAIATDSHKSNENVNNVQRHVLKEIQHHMDRTAKTEESVTALWTLVGKIGDGTKALITAQVLMVDEMAKLAAAQQKTEERMAILADTQASHAGEHDDLKDKLHVLYDVVDRWIREHGGAGKNGTPAPEPPPAA